MCMCMCRKVCESAKHVHARMHVRMCMCMCACVCMHVDVHVRMHVSSRGFVCVFASVHACTTAVGVHALMSVCMRAGVRGWGCVVQPNAPPLPAPSSQALQQLVAMGFDQRRAAHALQMSNNDLQMALAQLL